MSKSKCQMSNVSAHQIPKPRAPKPKQNDKNINIKTQSFGFGVWFLGIYLDFGVWDSGFNLFGIRHLDLGFDLMVHQKFNFKKLGKSFQYAFRGVIFLLASEQNARVHAVITVLVGIAAYVFDVTRLEAAILFMAVILVFAIEIINTAIEKVFDVCHPENHRLIAAAKDAMAGAVLISAIIATVVAILVFLPHFKQLFV